MKICLLHYAAPPVIGGVETVIAHHARLMANAGHEVCIIAGRGEQLDPSISFIKLPLVDSLNDEILHLKLDLDSGRVPADFELMVERIESELYSAAADTDWLVAHNVCSLNKNAALTAALRRMAEKHARPRLILWQHDLAWTTPRYRNELHDGYPWDLLRTDWPQAIKVVVSRARQAELAGLIKIPRDEIRVIPNGVDINGFLKLEQFTRKLIDKLELLSASPLILLPVRITPRKNIEFALKVLFALRSKFVGARLLVTGPLGPHNPANAEYYASLVALRRELKLESAAHFLAEIGDEPPSDKVISDLYRLADVLLLPSIEEGFGIPILEAGLSGIPVFCSDIPVLRELADGQAQYFSLNADPQVVAGQVAGSLTPNDAFTLRKRVRQEYSWEQIYGRHIAPI